MVKFLTIFLLFFLVSCNSGNRNNNVNSNLIVETIENVVNKGLETFDSDISFDDTQTDSSEVFHIIFTHYVTVNLRLRENASLDSTIITTLPQNTKIMIIDTGKTETIDGMVAPWVKVFSETGYIGWCFSGYINVLDITQRKTFNFPVILESVSWPNFTRQRDPNVIVNVNIVRFPESSAIQNRHEIDNLIINDVFNRPILNRDIMLLYHTEGISSFTINNLLNPLQIILPNEYLGRLNYGTNKLRMEEIILYFHGDIETDFFVLFAIEYENNSILYDFNVKIGTSREEIIERFGSPAFFTEDKDTYIYFSFSTFRQMNIIFDNDSVVRVQLMAWDSH